VSGYPELFSQRCCAAILLFVVAIGTAASPVWAEDGGSVPALTEKAGRQMDRCWRAKRLPSGGKSVDPFRIVAILDKDGHVRSSMLVDAAALDAGQVSRQVVSSAMDALSKCHFDLPPDLYDLWKQLTFTFDPALP
jgi:hypothetical protein